MDFKKLLRAFLIVAVVLLLVGSATAAPANLEDVQELPWAASYTGDWKLDESGSCDEGFTPLYTWGYGNATHLGAMKIETWDCVNLATGEIVDGVVKFTAANGDELHGTFSGQASQNGEFTIWSVYTGGTGRFEHATGEATEVGLVVPNPSSPVPAGTIEGTLIGWVAYDASDRT